MRTDWIFVLICFDLNVKTYEDDVLFSVCDVRVFDESKDPKAVARMFPPEFSVFGSNDLSFDDFLAHGKKKKANDEANEEAETPAVTDSTNDDAMDVKPTSDSVEDQVEEPSIDTNKANPVPADNDAMNVDVPLTVDHGDVSVGTPSLQEDSPGLKKGSASLIVDVTPASLNFLVIENFSLKTTLKGVRLVDEQGFPAQRQKLAIEQILPTLLIDFSGKSEESGLQGRVAGFWLPRASRHGVQQRCHYDVQRGRRRRE